MLMLIHLYKIKFWYGCLFPIIYTYTVWFQFLHRINAAFGVSSKFVPYRPNYDLVAKAVNAQNLYGEFAASTSITFESSLALVTIKRNDSNADNVAVYVVANLRDGLTYKPIISSENIPVTIARDSNNSKNVKITNNGSVYYFYLISRYPIANL